MSATDLEEMRERLYSGADGPAYVELGAWNRHAVAIYHSMRSLEDWSCVRDLGAVDEMTAEDRWLLLQCFSLLRRSEQRRREEWQRRRRTDGR